MLFVGKEEGCSLKKIISKTLLFAAILAFVSMFESIFGVNNTQVGITVIIAILVFLQEDLTTKPLENLIKLISINLLSGIFTYLSASNMWLGLFLNFAALTYIGYLFSFRMTKTMVVPFGLQYLFLLYSPVTGIDFRNRLIGLGVGAVLIMMVQFIVHGKKKDSKQEAIEPVKLKKEENEYRLGTLFGKTFEFHSVRAIYALKIGLLTALSAFAVAYFHLEQGRWIVYTIFSLTEIYSENTNIRSKQRLQGTMIGVAAILVLFIFIKGIPMRTFIIIAAGYLSGYTNNYRDNMIFVTISAVASTALVNGTFSTIIERIFFILIGILCSVLVNKLFFRKHSNKTNIMI